MKEVKQMASPRSRKGLSVFKDRRKASVIREQSERKEGMRNIWEVVRKHIVQGLVGPGQEFGL